MNSDDLPIKPETTDGAPGDCLPIPSEHIKTEQGVEAPIASYSPTEHYFKCSFHGCPFTTTTLKLHKEHKKRHVLKGSRKCLYCSFSSNKQSALTWHLLHHVEAQNTKPSNVAKEEDVAAAFYCAFPWCSFSTNNHRLLKRHQAKHSPSSLKCRYCSFKCKKANVLKAHLKQHEDVNNSTPEHVTGEHFTEVKNEKILEITQGKGDFLTQFLKYDKWSMRIYLQCPKCPFKKRCSQKNMFLGHLQKHSATALGTKCSFCTYKTTVKGIKIHELIHLDRKIRLKKDWCSTIKSRLLLQHLKAQKKGSSSNNEESNENSDHAESSNDINSLEGCEQRSAALSPTNSAQNGNIQPANIRFAQSNLVETSVDNGATTAQDSTSIQITTSGSELSGRNGAKSPATPNAPDDQDSNNQSITITITTSEACNNADLIKQALVSEILKKFDSGKSSVDLSCNNAVDAAEEFAETVEVSDNLIEASPVHNESLFSNEFEMFTDFTQDVQSESKGFMDFNSPSSSEENCLEELISNDCHSLFEVSTGADQISNLDVDGWGVDGFSQTVQSSIDPPKASRKSTTKAADCSKTSKGTHEDNEVIIVIDSDEENQSENNQRHVVKPKRKLVESRVQPQKKDTTNTNAEIYACNHCPSKFLIKSQLAIHNMLHIARAGLRCPLCSYTNNKTSLLKHLMCHVVSDEGLFKCPLCDTTKRNIEYMNDHFKVVHSGHIFQPHEDVCRRRFCSGCCGKLLLNNTGLKAKYRFI
ncbi:RE1-silencing transcription factor [Dendroctonus ponderosae]|uniref:RE1-silencing transcription factor n=1 Tax=Dendroctonus ponderosae TaxID=77166 RepID=UPI0020350A17|nr:RE1-silencing transcription factor [Dendroctonus ponderosae]